MTTITGVRARSLDTVTNRLVGDQQQNGLYITITRPGLEIEPGELKRYTDTFTEHVKSNGFNVVNVKGNAMKLRVAERQDEDDLVPAGVEDRSLLDTRTAGPLSGNQAG